MRHLIRLLTILLALLVATAAGAQDSIPQPPQTVIALSMDGGVLSVGDIALPGPAAIVDYNPAASSRYARIDGLGMLRFVPAGGPEGVYTFAPYFEGFTTESAEDNKLRVVEVRWSPNGEMLAFRIDSDAPDANDGVWFWQPAREIMTDPSYHLLRDCPPGCNLVTRPEVLEWRSISLEWSSDNAAILVGLELPEENNRRALTVRTAARDLQTTESRTGPSILRYDYGHWTADGGRIVVSGAGPDGTVVFGSIARDGSAAFLTAAADIGLAWAQDAVPQPETGLFVMLGSTIGKGFPLQLVDSTGRTLTPLIGSAAPDRVVWSPDRTAVLLEIGAARYVAQTDGTVTDITPLAAPDQAIDWVVGSLPVTARVLAIPAALVTPEAAPEPTVIVTPMTIIPPPSVEIGTIYFVGVTSLPLYAEPLAGSTVIADLPLGEALIVVAGPLSDGAATWWRIQTAQYNGWIQAMQDGRVTFGLSGQ